MIIRFHLPVCILSTLLLTLFAFPLWASPNTTVLDDTVVTATRSENSSFDVATPVSVMSQQKLQELGASSLSEALSPIAGVSMSGGGPWETTPIIRGMGSNRVLVLYDGDRETNLWSGREPLTPFLDVSTIERIEVVKGPSSVLYGSDALGGVINIISTEARLAAGESWQIENTLSGTYSSIDSGYSGSYTVNAGGEGLGMRLSIYGRDHDSYEDGDDDTLPNSQYEAKGLNLKALYLLNEYHKITAEFRIHDINDFGIPQKDPRAPESHFSLFNTRAYKLGYSGENLGLIQKFESRFFHVDQQRQYSGDFPNIEKKVHNVKENTIDTSATGGSIQATFKPSNRHHWITGVEMVHETTDSDETQKIQTLVDNTLKKQLIFQPVPDGRRDHFGLYAQDQITLTDRWQVTAGGRFDFFITDAEDVSLSQLSYDKSGALKKEVTSVNQFSRERDQALTYSFGSVYAINHWLNLTANLSTAFRAPDMFERYSTRGGGSKLIIGDPNLDAEYTYNADLGVKFFTARSKGYFNLYYNRIKDFIDLSKQSDSFMESISTYQYVNVEDAELYGFDWETTFKLNSCFDLMATMAWVEGKDVDTREHLNSIPPLNGSVVLRFNEEITNTLSYYVSTSVNLFDRQRNVAEGENETPGYTTLDLNFGLNVATLGPLKDIKLHLALKNLLDRNYRSHLRSSQAEWLYEPGRSIVTSMQCSF